MLSRRTLGGYRRCGIVQYQQLRPRKGRRMTVGGTRHTILPDTARRAPRRVALLAALTIACAWTAAGAASAAGPQVAVLYPLASGQLTSSPLENPPHHHYWGNFAIDDAAGAGTPVYARFTNANGALSLSLGGTFEPCAAAGTGGSGLIVNVFLNGQQVGSVHYAHLTGITQTTGAIGNGQQIGVLYNGPSTTCWTGPHTHVEPRSTSGAACFVSRGLNTAVSSNDVLGVIGGGYAGADNQTCPVGAEWFVNSIVQWDGDANAQKTSWLVGGDHHRRWVPDGRTYNCLRGRGIGDAGGLSSTILNQLGDLNGIWAQCPFGDNDYNGKVDIFDLSRLLSSYNITGAQRADDNYDGVVNIFDLSILLSNYGRTS
jgi:hypothetical protein